MTLAIDTHQVVKRLRDAGFTDVQAETVTDLLKDTRQDQRASPAHTSDPVAGNDRASELAVRRKELDAEVDTLRAEIRIAVDQVEVRIVKWLVPLMLAQVAPIVALLRLL